MEHSAIHKVAVDIDRVADLVLGKALLVQQGSLDMLGCEEGSLGWVVPC